LAKAALNDPTHSARAARVEPRDRQTDGRTD